MRRLTLLVGLFLAVPFVVAAQDNPKFEVFGGYTYTRAYNTDSISSTSNSNGGVGDVAFYPLKWIGLVGQVGYSHTSGFTNTGTGTSFTAPTNALSYFGGPRIRFSTGRITPYVQTLFGAIHRSNLEISESEGIEIASPETSFAYSFGGGVDFKLVRHISVRLIQASYLRSTFSPTGGPPGTQNDFNLQTGIVIH